jgi:hypothetical protein
MIFVVSSLIIALIIAVLIIVSLIVATRSLVIVASPSSVHTASERPIVEIIESSAATIHAPIHTPATSHSHAPVGIVTLLCRLDLVFSIRRLQWRNLLGSLLN